MADVGTLIAAASFIGAFGTSVLVFRLQREVEMAERGEHNWMPWADRLMLAASVISLLVVTLLLAWVSPWTMRLAASGLAGSSILAAGYSPAILAHYRLLPGSARGGARVNPEPIEKLVTIVSVLLAIVAAIVAYCNAGWL